MSCIFYSQFGCLKVTAVLLLVIVTSQGSKLDGRANAVEAESDLKTHTWKDVEDYNPEIFRGENYDKSDDDFLNVVQKRSKACSGPEYCQIINNAWSAKSVEDRRAVCNNKRGCRCRPNNGRNGNTCDQCFFL